MAFNKTQFILSFPLSTPAKEIVEAAKKKKVDISEGYIYSARSKKKVAKTNGHAKNRGRKPAAKPTITGITGPMHGKPVIHGQNFGGVRREAFEGVEPTNGHSDDSQLAKLITELGTDRAMYMINRIEPTDGLAINEKESQLLALLLEHGTSRARTVVADISSV